MGDDRWFRMGFGGEGIWITLVCVYDKMLTALVVLMKNKQAGKPGIVIMTDHPIARLLLYTIHNTTTSPNSLPNLILNLSSSHNITRPSSRPAEFFTGLVVDREEGVVVASLYTGVLTVIEVGIAKEGGGGGGGSGIKGKRKQSLGLGTVVEEELGDLVFGDIYEIK